jgi:LacI family transcriptional regulator
MASVTTQPEAGGRSPRRAAAGPPRVALAFDAYGSVHWLDVARGATAAAERFGWHIAACPDGPPPTLARLLAAGCDGVIAAVTTVAEARAARAAGVPIVNVSAAVDAGGLPQATFDNAAIGSVAAEHLLAQGYTHFAFYGLDAVGFSARRREGFAAALRGHGVGCEVLEVPRDAVFAGADAVKGLDRWLLDLAPGTGILATSDPLARLLLDVCHRLSIDVPGRLGILGVGDFPALCEVGGLALSSVRRNGFAVGAAAVEMLAGLLSGGSAPAPILVPPGDVAARDSTAREAAAGGGADEAVAIRAITLVQDDLAGRHNVESLARRLRVSRRKLERAFQSVFGESPHARVLRVRAEAAVAARTADPNRSLVAIARATGFTDARHLRRTLAQFGLD